MRGKDRQSASRPDADRILFVRNTGGAIPAAPRRRKKGKLSVRTGVFLIVLLIAVLLAGGLILYPAAYQNSSQNVYGQKDPYVGVLVVNGEISGSADASNTYQHGWVLQQVRMMRKDPLNTGMMLYVNSPGGSVFETDELYTELRKYQKKTGRPLYAYFDEMAASGGYYIAASADKIIANKLCTTGSIGVYMGPVIDASRLLTRYGISAEYIKSGRNKAMGNPFTPLTREQREIYQSQIDEYYERFTEIVSQGRKMPIDMVYEIADGRSYTASQALENHLIDRMGNFSQAKKAMKKDCSVGNFVLIQYQPQTTLIDYFRQLCDSFEKYADSQNKSEAQKALEYLSENDGRVFYYKVP